MKREDLHSALLADFYALTMAQGYWKHGMNHRAVFEMFFRKQPFSGGFSMFAGLGTMLEALKDFCFSPDDIAYLASLGANGNKTFDPAFLDFLKDFHFSGSIWAMEEGRAVFPQEPLVRVDAPLIECQILEAMLLNNLNFQTLIATKTARVWLASGKGNIMEFGLRRAQGPDGGMSASRAAYIGQANGTSNVLAAKEFGMPALGTMAHSWIMAFPSEEESFRAYAELYPNNTIFLIDTFDTINSGVPNAIKVGKEMQARGQNFGVRLDSGDIQYLTTKVRKMLDDAGLNKAFISVSNDLDENIILSLRENGAPIDSWGVGTQMVTGGYGGPYSTAAFTGVYKLMAKYREDGTAEPVIKFSDAPEKTTTPGVKQVWRLKDGKGCYLADVMGLDIPGEEPSVVKGRKQTFWHPSADYRHFALSPDETETLLKPWVVDGKPAGSYPSLQDIRALVRKELDSLDNTYKRILNPHIYKVSITENLRKVKLDLIHKRLSDA
jgi:nicotinate phosphoribosyltransferase